MLPSGSRVNFLIFHKTGGAGLSSRGSPHKREKRKGSEHTSWGLSFSMVFKQNLKTMKIIKTLTTKLAALAEATSTRAFWKNYPD